MGNFPKFHWKFPVRKAIWNSQNIKLRDWELCYERFLRDISLPRSVCLCNRISILRLSYSYRVACAVRYFWVALLRLRLSSLDKVPEPGAPTPLTATPPWPLFAMETVLSSFAKSQLKLFICLCVPKMFLSKRFSLTYREKLSSHLRLERRFASQNIVISLLVARSCNYSYDNY